MVRSYDIALEARLGSCDDQGPARDEKESAVFLLSASFEMPCLPENRLADSHAFSAWQHCRMIVYYYSHGDCSETIRLARRSSATPDG
jgi:hypothetical protein